MADLLLTAKGTIEDALRELDARRLPVTELEALLHELDRRPGLGDALGAEPYFIPNDPSQCTPTSVINCVTVDRELLVERGFAIQASATRPNAFAKPYYLDPIDGVHRCKGLFAIEEYADRQDWTYDLSFVGHRGKRERPHTSLLGDTAKARHEFFLAFQEHFVPKHGDLRTLLRFNDHFFFSDAYGSTGQRQRMNEENRYIESIRDSRLVLCPRGGGTNSIRFFETLAVANIPVYVGDKETRLPLDWLIDWERACFRISCEEVADLSFVRRLEKIVRTPVSEINARRRYAFRIYHQFLAPDRRPVFEALVLLRAREMLGESQ